MEERDRRGREMMDGGMRKREEMKGERKKMEKKEKGRVVGVKNWIRSGKREIHSQELIWKNVIQEDGSGR